MPQRTGEARPWRVGLLTPYSGTNLGDGAIHDAAIGAIRSRRPEVEFVSITLRPSETARRHGVAGFPLTGLNLPFYSYIADWHRAGGGVMESQTSARAAAGRAWKKARAWLKRQRVLAFPIAVAAAVRDFGRQVAGELRHTRRAFGLCRGLSDVIVVGGGQIDEEWGGPWGHPYAMFKWGVLARLAGARYVVMSVGASPLPSRLSRFFVRRALEAADYRSYRDPVSKQFLSWVPATVQDPCVPDVAFGLPPGRRDEPPDRGELRVGVSPIGFGHPGHWPTPDGAVFTRYREVLLHFVRWVLEAGHLVWLFTTSGVDRKILHEELLPTLRDDLPAGVVDRLEVMGDYDVSTLMAGLARTDVTIASRLHGVLLSHRAGCPAVAISFDRKVDTHMELLGQQRFCVPIASVEVEQLKRLFSTLVADRDAIGRSIAERVGRAEQLLNAQYDLLFPSGTE
jgi:polysaccharide pyruvyl transferase WcaK-like protein